MWTIGAVSDSGLNFLHVPRVLQRFKQFFANSFIHFANSYGLAKSILNVSETTKSSKNHRTTVWFVRWNSWAIASKFIRNEIKDAERQGVFRKRQKSLPLIFHIIEINHFYWIQVLKQVSKTKHRYPRWVSCLYKYYVLSAEYNQWVSRSILRKKLPFQFKRAAVDNIPSFYSRKSASTSCHQFSWPAP